MTKIIVTAVLGILTLSTTAFAGYKIYNNSKVKGVATENSTVIPTPETIVQIEDVFEEEKTLKLNNPTPIPTQTLGIFSTPSPTFFDSGDDDIEFGREEDDDEETDDQEDAKVETEDTQESPEPQENEDD